MKEAYFTARNIEKKSRKILGSSLERLPGGGVEFDSAQAALLVIDMQRYFLDPASHAFVPSAPAIVPRVAKLARAFIGRDRPVVLTRHCNTDRDAGMLGRWWGDMIREEDPLSAVADEIAGLGAVTVAKTQYDAFHGTELERALRRRGIGQIVVTGVVTHLCCETTARSAFVRGFAVFFAVDGTASYDEEHHRATLLNLSHGFAVPVLTGDLVSTMEG